VKSPLISLLVGGGGSIKLDPDNREDDPTASLYLIHGDFPVGSPGDWSFVLPISASESINIGPHQSAKYATIADPARVVHGSR
jgi:hypothetical protein